jgi:uncharacterized membrane protein
MWLDFSIVDLKPDRFLLNIAGALASVLGFLLRKLVAAGDARRCGSSATTPRLPNANTRSIVTQKRMNCLKQAPVRKKRGRALSTPSSLSPNSIAVVERSGGGSARIRIPSAFGAELPIRHVRASVAIRAKADLSLSIGEVPGPVSWIRAMFLEFSYVL